MTAVFPAPRERDSRFSPDPLHRPTAETYWLGGQSAFPKSPMYGYTPTGFPNSIASSASSTVPSSPEFANSYPDGLPYTPTTASSLSLSTSGEQEEDGIVLPCYDADNYGGQGRKDGDHPDVASANPSSETPGGTSSPCPSPPSIPVICRAASDDTSIEAEPSRHVDYLSHEWEEEDIWASWRYVVARRNVYSNGVRLENASWRSWAKSKYNLRTVSPETLNWLKDCDVTWLYGPLQTDRKRSTTSNTSPAPSRLSTPSSSTEKKSILKKRTASETILQRSLSQHTLLKHAGAILKAREAENPRGWSSFERTMPDRTRGADSVFGSVGTTPTTATSSGLSSPKERRHIHFNNEVVQCIAVETKDGEDEDDYWSYPFEDDESSDDGIVMMKQCAPRAPISSRNTSRRGFDGENKTIAPLPPTTLKYRGDTPEPPANPVDQHDCWPLVSKPSPTPSVETLRPPKPEANFLLDDDDDELDLNWQPKRSECDYSQDRPWFINFADEEEPSNSGLFDKVVDTINTARDIAHVIWNVGWRR